MTPVMQYIVGADPQDYFDVPSRVPAVGKSMRVEVNGVPAAFTRTWSTAITLRIPARAGSIVNIFEDATPSLTGLGWTGSLDFPAIPAQGSAVLSHTVTGAELGDLVSLGLPANAPAGVLYQGYVSATDVVSVRATNITAAAVDPATGVVRMSVSKV